MPRQPLPPDVLTRIVADFERTGNASQTSRNVGLPRETVRDALSRARSASRRQLHARACEAGLRQGRKALRDELTRLTKYTTAALGPDADTPLVEPRDYSALVRAQADLNRVLIAHDERVSARRTEALAREMTREKLRTLRGLGDFGGATDEELATVRAILERARQRGPTTTDPSGTGEAQPADDPAGEPR